MNPITVPRMALATACWAGLMVGAPAGTAAQTTEGSFERTLKVTGPVELDVVAGSGSIVVRPGGDGTVRILGRIRGSDSWRWDRRGGDVEARVRSIEQNPPIEQTGSLVRVGHFIDEDMRQGVSISYDIVTPANTSVRSRSGSGSQTIEGVRGSVEASAGSGSLRLDNIGRGVRASAGSGTIEMASIVGDVDARTGSGDVRVRNLRGASTVRTGSGSIEVDGVPEREWRLQASSGSITARLPESAAFELRARTSSGHINSRHPITVLGSFGRRELNGKVRGGGVLVDVATSSGSIRID